ncbi:hypothetical protein NA56DRAFT_282247 [Hyaloscypha hepaticicola]|uniref:Uncharacterized protein n=1 Tax=Hyaloscypha hepaticicola TaxID=2082293 RepID=A0A2J6PSE5_9HELO|nr:hypothetical protein NA56DRAFT_282247 [Hyaloscypha hepaticicola]
MLDWLTSSLMLLDDTPAAGPGGVVGHCISSYGPIMLLFPASLPQALQIFAGLNRGYKRRGLVWLTHRRPSVCLQSKKNIRCLSLLLPIFLDITPRGFLSSIFFCVGLVPCSHFKYSLAACGKHTTHSFQVSNTRTDTLWTDYQPFEAHCHGTFKTSIYIFRGSD